MSIIDNVGGNIAAAFDVVARTYENLELLFSEMDAEAEEAGYISLTPRFLRWKSDTAASGWLITDFIKLYQRKDEPSPAEESTTEAGTIYGVEVNFDEEYPKLWLIRYTYDFGEWTRLPAISDHWIFYYPLAESNHFHQEERDGLMIGKPVDEKARAKYWGIHKAIGRSIPLTRVDSRETIRSEIFEAFGQLPEHP